MKRKMLINMFANYMEKMVKRGATIPLPPSFNPATLYASEDFILDKKRHRIHFPVIGWIRMDQAVEDLQWKPDWCAVCMPRDGEFNTVMGKGNPFENPTTGLPVWMGFIVAIPWGVVDLEHEASTGRPTA